MFGGVRCLEGICGESIFKEVILLYGKLLPDLNLQYTGVLRYTVQGRHQNIWLNSLKLENQPGMKTFY